MVLRLSEARGIRTKTGARPFHWFAIGMTIGIVLTAQILVHVLQIGCKSKIEEDEGGAFFFPTLAGRIELSLSHSSSPSPYRPLWYNETFGTETNFIKKEKTTPLRNSTEPPPEEVWLLTPKPFPNYDRVAIIEAWRANSTNAEENVIPRTIHKVFLSKSGGFMDFQYLSEPMKRAHASWKIQNPGYDMQYFDLGSSRNYLQTHFHPVFLRAFDCIEAFAGKANFMRYAILYREGGWYSDWKEECLEPNMLEERLSPRHDFVYFMDKGLKVSNKGEFIMTAFLGATPRHPFFAATLKQTLVNVQTEFYGKKLPTENTGPGMLGKVRKDLLAQNRSDVFEFGLQAGYYLWNFYYMDYAHQVIQHKCNGCDSSKDSWGTDGNDYWKLHEEQTYYCQDAPSIFATTVA